MGVDIAVEEAFFKYRNVLESLKKKGGINEPSHQLYSPKDAAKVRAKLGMAVLPFEVEGHALIREFVRANESGSSPYRPPVIYVIESFGGNTDKSSRTAETWINNSGMPLSPGSYDAFLKRGMAVDAVYLHRTSYDSEPEWRAGFTFVLPEQQVKWYGRTKMVESGIDFAFDILAGLLKTPLREAVPSR